MMFCGSIVGVGSPSIYVLLLLWYQHLTYMLHVYSCRFPYGFLKVLYYWPSFPIFPPLPCPVFIHLPFLFHYSSSSFIPPLFYFLTVVSKVAIYMYEQVFLQSDEESFECMPISGIAGSHGRSVSSFVKNLHSHFIMARRHSC